MIIRESQLLKPVLNGVIRIKEMNIVLISEVLIPSPLEVVYW